MHPEILLIDYAYLVSRYLALYQRLSPVCGSSQWNKIWGKCFSGWESLSKFMTVGSTLALEQTSLGWSSILPAKWPYGDYWISLKLSFIVYKNEIEMSSSRVAERIRSDSTWSPSSTDSDTQLVFRRWMSFSPTFPYAIRQGSMAFLRTPAKPSIIT